MTAPDQHELEKLAGDIGTLFLANGQMLASAESCTGGWAAQCLTAIAGSSQWFERGFITYSNAAKCEMLGVESDVIDAHGAVSEAIAAAMALGALRNSRADWALAITGIAGPGGGSAAKPVGTVCFGWAGPEGMIRTQTCGFFGGRQEIRAQSVAHAFKVLLAQARQVAT